MLLGAGVVAAGKILFVFFIGLIGIKLGLQTLLDLKEEDEVVTLVRDGAVGVHFIVLMMVAMCMQYCVDGLVRFTCMNFGMCCVRGRQQIYVMEAEENSCQDSRHGIFVVVVPARAKICV